MPKISNYESSVAKGHSSTEEKFTKNESSPVKLGRFRILNEVGRGATAFVYKAHDPQLDRFLAIKVLRQELANDNDYRDAFIKEARLAAQLTHPGIVTIFDVGIAENKPYIAMELLEGHTLESILKSQTKVNLRTLLAMAIQLSRALNYAHKKGVVHRDIKPGNIVVLKDKKTVKLTDFGIAQLSGALGAPADNNDKVLGTPEYMSPEQILGKPVDNRSDLYSFGVLIFQLFMGSTPFQNKDLGNLFKQIIKDKPPLLVFENEIEEIKIKDDLNDLVRKLLRKKNTKRYQSAASVTSDLLNIQSKLGSKKSENQKGFISLRLRWTASMAGIMFIAMCISLVIVSFVQKQALSGISYDYGRSIARLIAFQSSEPMLLEDMVGLKALVAESSKNEQVKSIFVMDVNNKILASSDTKMQGKVFTPTEDRDLMQLLEKSKVYQRKLSDNQILFDIEIPILYGEKVIGNLSISYSADSMVTASKTTLVTMLTVMLITLLIVFIVTLVLARRTSQDFIRVTKALNKMSTGRVDSRLICERNDEVGQLFNAFNRLSQYLESHLELPMYNNLQKIRKVTVKNKGQASSRSLAETVELDIETDSNIEVAKTRMNK
jgi:serine/threonine-protein kinase